MVRHCEAWPELLLPWRFQLPLRNCPTCGGGGDFASEWAMRTRTRHTKTQAHRHALARDAGRRISDGSAARWGGRC